jgi:MFS family permease
VSMQLEVQEEFRGRLSAVIGMGFSSIGPLMSFPWGHLADYIGPPRTILIAAVIFGCGSAALAFFNRGRTLQTSEA